MGTLVVRGRSCAALLALSLASFSLAGCSDDAPAAAKAEQCKGPSDAGDAGFVPATPAEIECGLGRGVNLGNIFEAPEPGDWSVEYDADWLPLLKSAGFSHIRLPVRWTNHAALSADATLDETFATRIDEVIDAALANGLYVVVDAHHYRQLDGEPLDPGEAEVASIDVQERLVNIWRQLSARYHERSNRLVYELYNEPHGQQMAPGWNALAARLLAAVRENDPERVVIVGASEWNDPTSLHELKLPDDSNLIVTFHYYEPYHFVFQGTFVKNSPAWVGITCCDELQRIQIQSGIEIAALFSKQHGVPMYLGEFGSSIVADKASRVDYSRFVRDQAEAHGMPWAVWSMVDMGIYDPDTKAFRPEVLEALVGP